MGIKIDDEATWPEAVTRLLEGQLAALAPGGRYRERESREASEALAREISAVLGPEKLVCCHCTRLTPDEVEDVRANGLRPLSRELCEERVARRVAAGDFTRDQAQRMLSQYARFGGDELRDGRLWAVLGHAALSDEDGLGAPLAWWGGETILDGLPPSPHYLVGQAAIVEFVVRAEQSRVASIGWAFLAQYLYNRDLYSEDGAADICIAEPVPAADIRRMVLSDAPLFEAWTQASTWRLRV